MRRRAYSVIGFLTVTLILGHAAVGLGQMLSGRAYEGGVGDESDELPGVTVSLYGAPEAGGPRTHIVTQTTASNGWYGLPVAGGFEHYYIVAESGPDPTYTFEGATSVGGSASGNEIHYSTLSAPLDDQIQTGNKFWYKKEGEEPPENRPPVATDDSATTTQDTAVDIDVLTNDTDPDGDPLHVNSATDPPHGSTTNHGTHVTYTPEPGFTGTDTFDYTAGDGKGGTDTASVMVTVEDGGEPPADTGTIRGTKFNDLNGNGPRDVGEPGLPGWQIILQDSEGNVLATATTDANGEYAFTGLEPGAYEVDEVPQAGWRQTYPEIDGGPAVWVIGLEPEAVVEEIDFGNYEDGAPGGTGEIHGRKWNDRDGQGDPDEDEEGLPGWRIFAELEEAADGQWELGEPFAITDDLGYYAITGLSPGAYRVSEEDQPGWAPTFPPEKHYSGVMLSQGQVLMDHDFGNHQDETPPEPLEGEWDFGDAPEGVIDGNNYNYPTTLANNGARHRIVASGPCLRLNSGWPRPDAEPDGQPNIYASGDDVSGDMDEYAAWSVGWPYQGRVCQVRVYVDGGGGYVDAWLDFNRDGTWQHPQERIVSRFLPDGHHAIDYTVPGDAVPGETFARVRINSKGPLPPYGPADDGEVVDDTTTIYEVDYGDAPDPPYPTLDASGGPWSGVPGYFLGTRADGELDGQPDAHALGDDNDGTDDDDGVTFLTKLIPGQEATVKVVVELEKGNPNAEEICAWIDFNQNGDWEDSELAIRQGPLKCTGKPEEVECKFTVPAGAVLGTTYARFTVTYLTYGAPTQPDPPQGQVSGEIEDYEIVIGEDGPYPPPVEGEYDFGDAPDAYKTLHSSGGPYHDVGEVRMGNSVDAESDGQPGPPANADNDDGVLFPLGLQVDQFATVLVHVNAPAGVRVAAVGWIDYDQNGTFKDPEERFVTINATGAGVPVAMTETIKVPSTAKSGWTYARFRIYRMEVGVAIVPSPTGYAEEGEVEDYRVEIKPRGDTPPAGHFITGIKFNDLDGDGLWEPGDGEARLPNWTIWLDTNADGQPDQTTTTDSNGGFEFPAVPPGTYTIGEQQQPGWTQTAPPAPGTLTLTVPGGLQPTISFCMFGNRRTGGSGSVTVVKKASPADDTPFDFVAHTPGGFFDVLVNKLSDPSANTWSIGDLDRLQKVVEAVPAGWNLNDIAVTGDADHGSSVDLANATVYVDYDEGENIVIVFTNTKIPSRGEYDFGDAPVSYGNAWHTLNDNLTMGPTIDAEAGPNYSSDATGDDTHQTDDEDGMTLVTSLKWGAPATVCVEVHNNDSNPSDVTIAGWIDFDGNGQWDPVSEEVGIRAVHAPPFSIVKECWTFTVPQSAKPGDTFARFRLYRDDPNPLAIPFAVLPTGDGGEGEVEDYRVYILSDAPGPDDELDYGDAPSSYGSSSHGVGRLRIGDLIDGESTPKYSANADGDDLDNMADEDGVSLKSDLVPGQNAGLEIKLTTAPGSPDAHSTAWVAVWIDFNQDGQFQDSTEVITPYAVASILTPQFESRLYHFTVPATAKTGTTFMRVRATTHPGPSNQQWSSTGYGGEGEVEDYQVTIKNDGQVVPPGQIFGGVKFNDLNGNGQQDGGEPGLANWTIWIDLNGNGVKDAGENTLTNPDGSFYFTVLSPGTYTVHEELQNGWQQTYPGGAGTHTITVQAGQVVPSVMFGNRRSGGTTTGGRICGSKWHDLNGDGAPDAAEPWLANWKIYLDLNLNGQWDTGEPFRLTDAAGSFEFTGLAVGSYAVAEEMQPGWSQTWPGGAGTHVIQIQSGVQPACVLFGNRQGGPGPGPGQTFDWGDAPDPTYPTLRAGNGAYHVIVPGFHLGASVDDEPDAQPTPDALGDDNFDMDDEDGVAFLTPILPGGMAGLEIVASAAGFMDAWIDFDGDGNWSQPGDQILAAEPVAVGSNVLSVAIPASAHLNIATFARFRLSRTGGLLPEGPAQDGEVEDYHILLGEEGPGVPGEAELPHLKWSQPPIEIDLNLDAPPVVCGWGEVSTSAQDLGGRRSWSMRVDDFHCLGPIPITRVRWWGSYKAWESVELPEVLPDHWRVCFWANEPDDSQEDPFLPETVVHTLYVAPERVRIEPVGSSEFPDARSETCFAYEVALEPHEFFQQVEFPADEQVFWISITAVYPEGASRQNGWRWMTRPSVWGRGAEGFVLYDEGPDAQPSLFPGLFSPVLRASPCDRDGGYDLCFELLTDEPWVKWDQPFTGIRDWPHYADVESQGISIRQDESVGRLVADDWLCERDTPVIAAAWWGSYIGYRYEACACEQSREPPRPDYFLLQLWTVYSEMPGDVIWEYRAYDYDEVLVGYDRNPRGEPNEPVFRYSVRLPEDSWFHQSGADGAYWFSVTAVYTDPLPMILHPWGWTSHRHVFGSPALIADGDPQMPLEWHEPHSSLWPADMSFTLFTVPQSGPIAHWRFDESDGDIAFDSAGENHGTVHGATWTEGIIEGAIRLNGFNGYVDCGESDVLGPEQMTLTMWLFPEHMGGMRSVLSRARAETDADYGLKRHLEGQIEFFVVSEQDGPVSVVSNETTPLGEWSHVAAICDAEQLSLCINGHPDGTTPCPPRPLRTGYRFVIGSLLGQTRFYHGMIDDVQLHGVPLPPEHIAEIAGN